MIDLKGSDRIWVDPILKLGGLSLIVEKFKALRDIFGERSDLG